MRVIKFRGKRVDTGEWVYGNYGKFSNLPLKEIYLIESYYGEKNEVDHKTVGQYTGLKDKNGVEIYEGDVDENADVVTWCENKNGWSLSTYDFKENEKIFCNCYNCEGHFEIYELLNDVEVIGNIHDK